MRTKKIIEKIMKLTLREKRFSNCAKPTHGILCRTSLKHFELKNEKEEKENEQVTSKRFLYFSRML